MRSPLTTTLAVLSLVGCAFAYEYDASSLRTAATAVKGVFALVFIILTGLAIPVLAMARGHRVPYIPLLIALILTILSLLSSMAYDLLVADVDFDSDIPADAYTATLGIRTLFEYWSFALVFLAFASLVKVRADNILPSSGGHRLNVVWTIGYLVAFFFIFVFATATSGLFIDYLRALFGDGFITIRELNQKVEIYDNVYYTFNAVWYASSIFLGALAFFAYNKARLAGTQDTVLKTLLFVAFPIHMLHILESFIYVIIWSPSGIDQTFDNLDTIERANLAEVILSLLLHAGTIAALIIVGLRRANWLTPGEANAWQKGGYPGHASYPVQTVYPAQVTYPAQANYQTQSLYVDNTKA